MSSSSLIAAQDSASIAILMDDLPQSLIINTEDGLDARQVIDTLTARKTDEVTWIQPQEDKKYISTDQVRHALSRTITFSKNRRIIIIDPAASMRVEAQNALLKSLEEPNANLHFILLKERTEPILPTITSRCQTLNLHRTSEQQDAALLDSLKVDARSRQQILFLAAGRPLLIKRLATQPKILERNQSLVVDAKTMLGWDKYKQLVAIHNYTSDRTLALKLLDTIATIIHFQLKNNAVNDRLSGMIDKIQYTQKLINGNANTKLALLALIG